MHGDHKGLHLLVRGMVLSVMQTCSVTLQCDKRRRAFKLGITAAGLS